ncbi:SPOR domain-containing protein [Thalassotalea sp. LPB0316]|uniref:SPOR domain-containing protein n=1 Tax=Thalassotalea sp. LPB0316 TaxID=2769490 RepID=UPI001868CCF6|nr:SPOR domain-containing protein [Thalassotalea sp. LPB0316]QOL26398.1 SPOR domain-containing protein [Thalassotalea sp. LPB0316]
MKTLIVSLSLFLISHLSYAEKHQVYLLSSYDYQSAQDVGFNAGYQYFFRPNFAVQMGFDHSGELEKYTNDALLVGEFDSLYFGATMQKQVNERFASFASVGAMYVTDSSNQAFLSDKSTLPYLGLGFNFAVSNNLAITLKHQSQFSNQAYKDMHSLNLGLTFSFGQSRNKTKTVNSSIQAVSGVDNNKIPPAAKTPIEMTTSLASAESNTLNEQADVNETDSIEQRVDSTHNWYIQLGVFVTTSNAETFVKELKAHPNLVASDRLVTVMDGKLNRVLIGQFNNKKSATDWQTTHLMPLAIDSYVLQVKDKD